MPEVVCANYSSCLLVNSNPLALTSRERQGYIETYCNAGQDVWQICMRYKCKEVLHFCPDFVLPDTDLSFDEIVDKFDELNQ